MGEIKERDYIVGGINVREEGYIFNLKDDEDIKLIKKKNKFNSLPEGLKEIANLRVENPDVSLVELGRLLKEPIGKSGVNHRLKKLSSIAEELRLWKNQTKALAFL